MLLVAAAFAWPIHTVWPVRDDTIQRGFLRPVEQLCHLLGPRAAVVILKGGRGDQVLPQSLRSYCDIRVAVGDANPHSVFPVDSDGLAELARLWRKSQRTLFLIADGPERIARLFPGVAPVGSVVAANTRVLRRTIGDRPHDLVTETYRFVVVEVPPATTPAGSG